MSMLAPLATAGLPSRAHSDDLAVLGVMRDRAQLADEHEAEGRLESGRHHVAERGELVDRTVPVDPEHPVVVPIGHQEPAEGALQRELHAGVDKERRRRRVLRRPLSEIGYECALIR